MKRREFSAVAVLAVFLLAGVPAAAITSGTHDGTAHPAVAWVIETNGTACLGNTFTGSSAVLVSDNVLLITGDFAAALQAGFGTQFDNVWVNFDPENAFDCTKFEHVASIHVHPSFNPANLDVANLGALVLDATASSAPAGLPVAGRLDGLSTSQAYTIVGYGFDKGQNVLSTSRRSEPAAFRALGPEVLDLRMTRNGPNAPCLDYEDEGGAAYLGSTTEIVGMKSYNEKGSCRVGNFERLDNQTARSFLASLGVPLP